MIFKLVKLEDTKDSILHSNTFPYNLPATNRPKNITEALNRVVEIQNLIKSLARYQVMGADGTINKGKTWHDDFYQFYVSEDDLNHVERFITRTIDTMSVGHEMVMKIKMVDEALKLKNK